MAKIREALDKRIEIAELARPPRRTPAAPSIRRERPYPELRSSASRSRDRPSCGAPSGLMVQASKLVPGAARTVNALPEVLTVPDTAAKAVESGATRSTGATPE